MGSLVVYIDEDTNDLILAMPGDEIKWASVSKNTKQVEILRSCPTATKEEFKNAVKESTSDMPAKATALILGGIV